MDTDRETDDLISRNIRLTGVFLQAILEDPTLAANIPEGANVFLLPADDPVLAEANLEGARSAQMAGQSVYVHRLPSANGRVPVADLSPAPADDE